MLFSVKISVFYCRHQCKPEDTTRVPTTQTINPEDASRNAASPTDNVRERNDTQRMGHFGDKSCESNKDVTDVETIINVEEGDVRLIVPNYMDNTKGLFTRNVNTPEKVPG